MTDYISQVFVERDRLTSGLAYLTGYFESAGQVPVSELEALLQGRDTSRQGLAANAVEQEEREASGTDAPVVITDEPGEIWKLTGPNSVSSPGPERDPRQVGGWF